MSPGKAPFSSRCRRWPCTCVCAGNTLGLKEKRRELGWGDVHEVEGLTLAGTGGELEEIKWGLFNQMHCVCV